MYQNTQQQKLEKLARYEENFLEARQNLKKAEEQLEKDSYVLSEIRKDYSKTLTEKIIEGLRDLNFLDVKFRIDFQRKQEFTDNGYDSIEYEISTNPGESVKPLGRIVSGGELSRIMLAIKAILADRDQIETLIFVIQESVEGRLRRYPKKWLSSEAAIRFCASRTFPRSRQWQTLILRLKNIRREARRSQRSIPLVKGNRFVSLPDFWAERRSRRPFSKMQWK